MTTNGKRDTSKGWFESVRLKIPNRESLNFSLKHFKDGRRESLQALAPKNKMAALACQLFWA